MPPRRPRGASHSGMVEFDVPFRSAWGDMEESSMRQGGGGRRQRGASMTEFDIFRGGPWEEIEEPPQEQRRDAGRGGGGGGRRQRAQTDFSENYWDGRRSPSFGGQQEWLDDGMPYPFEAGAAAAIAAMSAAASGPPYGGYQWHMPPFMPPPAYTGYHNPWSSMASTLEWGRQMYLLGKGGWGMKGRGRGRGGGGGGHRGGGGGERERSGSKPRRTRAATAGSASPEKVMKSEDSAAAKTAKRAVIVKIPDCSEDPTLLDAPVKVHIERPPPVDGTTVMLRNIPNRYTQKSLLALLDEAGFNKAYDFVYLPMDFRNGVNLGYAFVNLVGHEEAKKLMHKFDGWKDWDYDSSKVCETSWAHPHQGLEQHVERYRNSPVMHGNLPDSYRPVLFKDGVPVPFPPATKAIRAPKYRPLHDRAAAAAAVQ